MWASDRSSPRNVSRTHLHNHIITGWRARHSFPCSVPNQFTRPPRGATGFDSQFQCILLDQRGIHQCRHQPVGWILHFSSSPCCNGLRFLIQNRNITLAHTWTSPECWPNQLESIIFYYQTVHPSIYSTSITVHLNWTQKSTNQQPTSQTYRLQTTSHIVGVCPPTLY